MSRGRANEAASGQYGFHIDSKGNFSLDLLDNLMSKFGASSEVQDLVFGRKIWEEVPDGELVILDLVETRKLYYTDADHNVFGGIDFNPEGLNLKNVSMAVILLPHLALSNNHYLPEDIEAVIDHLHPKGGGVIIVEQTPTKASTEDLKIRQDVLRPEDNGLIKPNFLTGYPGLLLWETRRQLPQNHGDWRAVQRYQKALEARLEQQGVRYFIGSNGGVVIRDDRGKYVQTSEIGEPGDEGSLLLENFSAGVQLPSLTEKQRKLWYALASKARQELLDSGKFLITAEMFEGVGKQVGTCSNLIHADAYSLMATASRMVDKKGKVTGVILDVACGGCDNHPVYGLEIDVKSHKRTFEDGTEVRGYIPVRNDLHDLDKYSKL